MSLFNKINKCCSLFVLLVGFFFVIKTKVFACTNGATQCSGNSIQVCINSSWSNVSSCTYGCSGGKCNSPPPTVVPTKKPTPLLSVRQQITLRLVPMEH